MNTNDVVKSAARKPTESQMKALAEIRKSGFSVHYRTMKKDGSGIYVVHGRYGNLAVEFEIRRKGSVKTFVKDYVELADPGVIASMIRCLPFGVGGRDE